MFRSLLFVLIFFFSLNTTAQIKQQEVDSLKSLLKNNIKEGNSQVLINLIKLYEYEDKDSARAYTERLIRYGVANDDIKAETRGILIKAKGFNESSVYDSAQYYYDLAKEKLKRVDDYELNSIYFGDTGVMNFLQGDFKKALENFDKALDFAKRNGEKDDVLRFLNNKALAMSYLGQATASIDVHQEAMKMAVALNDSVALGRSFNNLGLIYEDMKAYEKALEYYEKALVIKRRHSTPVDLLNSLYNVAGMHRELAEQNNDSLLLNKAAAEFTDLIEQAKAENYGKLVLFSQAALAQVATSKREFQKAIALYKPVIEAAEAQKDNQTLRIAYLNTGTNYFELNDFREALNYLNLAKAFIEKAENPSDQAQLYKNLSKTQYQLGNYKEAYEYNLKYVELSGGLISDELQEKITDFEVKYETEQKENQILEQRAQLAEKDLEVRRKNAYIFGSLGLAIILGLLGYLIYSRQKQKNRQLQKENELQVALAKIETQNRLEEQRLRISRDLHDNIGSQLTFIIISLDNLSYMFKETDEKIKGRLASISAFTATTINELRDTIWAMNKESISLEDLQTRIAGFIDKAYDSNEKVRFSFDRGENVKDDFMFTSVEGINIYRIIQEAVNNAMKYAKAQHITVEMGHQDNIFEIFIKDDGRGFDSENYNAGNGISNMQKRAADINANLTVNSAPGKGTSIHLISKN